MSDIDPNLVEIARLDKEVLRLRWELSHTIERANLTVGLPCVEWALAQRSVGVDVVAEDARLRAALEAAEKELHLNRQALATAAGNVGKLLRTEEELATEQQMASVRIALIERLQLELKEAREAVGTTLAAADAAVVGLVAAGDRLAEKLATVFDELAEHYPIAITARAMCNDEATEQYLREVIDTTMNSPRLERRYLLPKRLQELAP